MDGGGLDLVLNDRCNKFTTLYNINNLNVAPYMVKLREFALCGMSPSKWWSGVGSASKRISSLHMASSPPPCVFCTNTVSDQAGTRGMCMII